MSPTDCSGACAVLQGTASCLEPADCDHASQCGRGSAGVPHKCRLPPAPAPGLQLLPTQPVLPTELSPGQPRISVCCLWCGETASGPAGEAPSQLACTALRNWCLRCGRHCRWGQVVIRPTCCIVHVLLQASSLQMPCMWSCPACPLTTASTCLHLMVMIDAAAQQTANHVLGNLYSTWLRFAILDLGCGGSSCLCTVLHPGCATISH